MRSPFALPYTDPVTNPGRLLAARGIDPVAGMKRRGSDPQPLLRTAQPPCRLIQVHRLGPAHRVSELGPRVGEDRVDPRQRVVDRALRGRDPEHLADDLANLVSGESEHPGEDRDMRLQPRPIPRQRRARKLGQHRAPARRTLQTDTRMLEHQRAGRRQLVLLVEDRVADPLLPAAEQTSATTALRQMLKPPIDVLRVHHLPRLALMPGLPARLAHRALIRLPRPPTPLRPRQRRIRRRRHRTVSRVAVHPALQLLDPLAQPRVLRPQLRDQRDQFLVAQPPCSLACIRHARTIPCVTQEPCSNPRHPVNANPARGLTFTTSNPDARTRHIRTLTARSGLGRDLNRAPLSVDRARPADPRVYRPVLPTNQPNGR